MFNSIFVPVDNSEYSNQAVHLATRIGKKFDSQMVGCHVYAAAMHDYRFKQMEFTLPAEYLQEEEIERQRKIHDSLITMGLELISDCYLTEMDKCCQQAGLGLERRMMDGKHHVEILKDIQKQRYDLTVLGALGVGRTRDSQIGSVCERVVRHIDRDVLVVKHLPKEEEKERNTIMVGVDGSPQSFGALVLAAELAKKFDKHLELISVYDPYLHYAVFNSIVDVLTDKAAKVFRFEEQNQLHEEIIDTGLAQIYQSHLNVGESMARDRGVEVSKTLIDGKAFQKILQRAQEAPPWLLVLGKIGVHHLKEENAGLGSNSENLLRLAPCDVLLTTRYEYPALDKKAEESILWTEQAEARMERVPSLVKGIARTGILRLAIEQGHSVITDSVIQEAMDRFMPKHTAQATTQLAETLAFEKVRKGEAAQCRKCGVVASESKPVQCGVCGAKEFDVLSQEVLEEIASAQGGVQEEVSYDGRKLRWSGDARKLLLAIEDKYQKRRAKARIEKSARIKKVDVITYQFARSIIEDEIGPELPFDIPERKELTSSSPESQTENALADVKPLKPYDLDDDLKVVGVDEEGNELKSVFHWTADALERMLKVPSGFMRTKTQERVERLALEARAPSIDLNLMEAGLDIGRQMMRELVESEGFLQEFAAATDQKGDKPEGKCPFSSFFEGDGKTQREAYQKVEETYQAQEEATPAAVVTGTKELGPEVVNKKRTVSHVRTGAVEDLLNQAGLMHEMGKRRRNFSDS